MSSHDYHIAAEVDVKPSASRHIWFYLVFFCVLLFAIIWGLIIVFRFQVDREKEQKICVLFSHESLDQKAISEAYLSGKIGIFPDKKNISISEAMSKFLADIRRGK